MLKAEPRGRKASLKKDTAPKVPSWRTFSKFHTAEPTDFDLNPAANSNVQKRLPWRQRKAMDGIKQIFTNRQKYVYADMPKKYVKGEDGKLHRVKPTT